MPRSTLGSRKEGVLRVEGRKSTIANIRATNHGAKECFRIVTRRVSQEVRDLAVQLAPKETGYMARNIKQELTPDELEFVVFCDPMDYIPHGIPYYPPHQEFGTSVMAAQPFLRPAYEIMAPHYYNDIKSCIRRIT